MTPEEGGDLSLPSSLLRAANPTVGPAAPSGDELFVNANGADAEKKAGGHRSDLHTTSHSTCSDAELTTPSAQVTKLKGESANVLGTKPKILIVANGSFPTKRTGSRKDTPVGQAIPSRGASTASDDGHPDLSLILALERTFFAALNNAWLLAIGGIGLMSVGEDTKGAIYAGVAILAGGDPQRPSGRRISPLSNPEVDPGGRVQIYALRGLGGVNFIDDGVCIGIGIALWPSFSVSR
eukprot:CAMPEP_0172541612 /NCGR_PEP_ID=MMETSP1067-20121228/12388_1 /TAXON_ID=265564 ORGANISM="Thalassiosira punctigera, Strain Tpunct2005C2" /NCGR_SAMPLE_ID=MMETSP1067 /ASSEMBLY_ACC=CAM_ASM_000444 /LENGTH=237 /DNA_ID=CAMNT_0013327681 /DNA_START=84 /DNA_END=796 /DNA_ORIENTATION=-